MSLELIKEQFYQNKEGWIKSFSTGFCQDEEGEFLPWMCYPLIEFLDQNLKGDEIVFEFGFGTSSLFFSKRVKKVYALETRRDWFEIMVKIIEEKNLKNIEAILLEDGIENENYENFPEKIINNSYKEGVDKIFGLDEDFNVEKFDLIVIDSIKRAKSCQNSLNFIKNDGKILLDDSERKGYRKIYDFMKEKGLNSNEFQGISPGQIKLKKGVLFSK